MMNNHLKTKKRRTQSALANARKASAEHLQSFIQNDGYNDNYEISVCHANDLNEEQRKVIWDIYEFNMRELLEKSSLGWGYDDKRSEIFHKDGRFILVKTKDNPALAAFLIFRFDKEDGRDIAYCYEVQVSSKFQGRGIGETLISSLAKIVAGTGMLGIMLTALKSNKRALNFYHRLGFVEDVTSLNFDDETMTYIDDEDCDIHILYLNIQPIENS